MRSRWLVAGLGSMLCLATSALAQGGPGVARALPPGGYGSLNQDQVSLRVRTDETDVRFLPLDPGVLKLMAPDSYASLRNLVLSRRAAIDSVATSSGVSRPGLALVSFFALAPNARIDPQTLTLLVRNRVFQPLGIVPLSPRFTAQQLNVREQVSGIYLYEEELPVDDSFTISYQGLTSGDWRDKQPQLDRERARVAARSRTERRDTVVADSGR